MADKSMDGLNTFTAEAASTVDATKKVRIGIIGCGWIAESHAKAFKNQPDAEIVALADLIPGKAKAFAEKFEYFGGSLTAGTGAPSKCWRVKVGNWLKTNFPKAQINNINRAVGESGTYLGTYRVQRDVIAAKPDLLFIEYSINDYYYNSSYDDAHRQFETIVREVKEALPTCDIVTVLVTNKALMDDTKAGTLHTQAQAHEDISKIYNIPSINVGRALADTVQTVDKWSDYATDTVHLNEKGYDVYFSCIEEYLSNSLLCIKPATNMLEDILPAVVSDRLFDGNRQLIEMSQSLLTASEALGGSGFICSNSGFWGGSDAFMQTYTSYVSSTNKDSVFAFKFNGTECAIFASFFNGTKYTTKRDIMVSVDGGTYKSMQLASHNPTIIVQGLASGEHTVKIKANVDSEYPTFKLGVIYTMDTTKETVKGSN